MTENRVPRSLLMIAIIGLVVATVLSARLVMVSLQAGGGSSYVDSPDGRFEAGASNMSGPMFWGGEHHWINYYISSEDEMVFTARYEMRGECRAGTVKWDVRPAADKPSEVEQVVHFDCGPTLTLVAENIN